MNRTALSCERWSALWDGLHCKTPAATFDELIARYAEPHRHYHNARHIDECLMQFDTVRTLCAHHEEVELALWFHDAIYNPRVKNNEEQSAQWAVRVLAGAGAEQAACDRVRALIMATRHDAVPASADARILVDIDLSILGAETARFDEYERQVRAEYAWVPEFLFRRTRRTILEGFLARPVIYSTNGFRQKLELRARDNLARSLRNLSNAGSE